MADEWVPMFAQGSVLGIPFICANATGIEMGTAVALSDPFTAAANSAIVIGASCAGVTLAEKIASNAETTVSVARSGIWKVVGSGNITAGDPVCLSCGNRVEKAATNEEDLVGTALETSTDGESLLIELKPFGISLA